MSDSNSSAMTAVVAIVAIVVIIAIGYFVVQKYHAAPANDGTSIDVNLPTGSNTSTSGY